MQVGNYALDVKVVRKFSANVMLELLVKPSQVDERKNEKISDRNGNP